MNMLKRNTDQTHDYLSLKWTVFTTTLLTLPFLLLEWANRRISNEAFPLALPVLLWLLPAASILTLIPLGRDLLKGKRLTANPVNLLIRTFLFVLAIGLWLRLILGQ